MRRSVEYDVWSKNNDLTISTECRTWLFFSTKCRTRRNVASTKSRMRLFVVSAKWFSTNCRAPLSGKCEQNVNKCYNASFFPHIVGYFYIWIVHCSKLTYCWRRFKRVFFPNIEFIPYTRWYNRTVTEELIQNATSRARMDSGKLTMFWCLQAIIGGVVSRVFAEK